MEHYGFFNGDQEYGQEEFSRYFDNIYKSGISVDDNNNLSFRVYIDENNKINIDSGFSIIRGFYLYNDNTKALNIERNQNFDRIDRIVIRLNLSDKTMKIIDKQGEAKSNPKPPNLQRDNLVWELSLAQIYIPKQGELKVTDERFKTELCGAIRPKNLTEFNTMIIELQKRFDNWFNSQQAKGWRNVFIQPNQPEGSVQGSIWIQTI